MKMKIKALLYTTKAKPILRKLDNYFLDEHADNYYWKKGQVAPYNFNGKITAECEYEVEEICSEKIDIGVGYEPLFYTKTTDDISKGSCLTQFEIEDYLGCKVGGEVVGKAIHIKNLHIFDKPRELSDYYTRITDKDRTNDFKGIDVIFPDVRIDEWFLECVSCKKLEKAPQNMQKIITFNKETNEYEYAILISIQPQWMCLILNRVKDVEVRRVVLKEML